MFETLKNIVALGKANQRMIQKQQKFGAIWEHCSHKEFPTVEQVEKLIRSEVKKYDGFGFEVNLIRRDTEAFDQTKVRWQTTTAENLKKKFGFFGKVTGLSAILSEAAVPSMERGMAGETLVYEVNGKDAVNFYIDVFVNMWFYLAEHYSDTWQSCVKAIVKHEFRHVKQFLELRRRGNGYVLMAFSRDIEEIDYLNKHLEIDAFQNQWLEDEKQEDIKAVIDRLVIAKFRRSA